MNRMCQWFALGACLCSFSLDLVPPAFAATQTVALATAAGPTRKTSRIVILSVDHSAQLVSRADQPGMLTAFIERLHPDAKGARVAP